MRKPTRTISGVAPVAIMLPPRPCAHGACVYCPALNSPQSYTPESPVVLRASEVKFDSFAQVKNRINVLKKMGHPTDKIELIVMGGTFLNYPIEFQYSFIKGCYDALNEKISDSLSKAKKLNETAKHRCIALCIETRPDFCSYEDIHRMLEFGTTRVELGVQAIDDKIYKLVNRGHSVNDVIEATKRLKIAGFKVGYHLMPGIPGSNPKKDLEMYKKIFSDERFKPDQVKIYPCQVIKGSALEFWYKDGKYKVYNKEKTKSLLVKMIKETPRYCRIMRIMREIPLAYLVSGIENMDLRKEVEEEIRHKKIKINEIRFREVGFAEKENLSNKLKIKLTKYFASDGTEYFIEFTNKDNILFGLLRLRLENNKTIPAMVRELHVYGPALDLGEKEKTASQHKGLGRMLMAEAEKISKSNGFKSMRVISGIGVREYYKKLGYSLDKEGYMAKKL